MPKEPTKRTPTIKDVAALAGTSVSTVSRYLNHSSHISEEASASIAKAIALLEYRPSGIARGLVTASTKSIAVLSSNTTLLGSAVTIQGIEDRARELGYAVTISKLDEESTESGKAAVCMALDQHPCGIIVLKYDDTAIKAVTYIPESMPCVVIGGDFDPYHAHISLDEYQAGLRLTEYLLRTGAPTVHHVSVPGAGGGRNRSSGWRAALRNRGLDIPESFTVGWSPDKARDLGRQFAHRPDITAIFAGNDEIAMGLMSGLMDEGRRISGDVRVVGFDDHPLSAIWRPALTTYRQDFRRAGITSVDMLLRQLDDGRDTGPDSITLTGELIVRQSA